MRTLALVLLLGTAGVGPCLAQQQSPVTPRPSQHLPGENQQVPPTKKVDGICYPPNNINYGRFKDFIPFVTVQDFLKSGGRLAK